VKTTGNVIAHEWGQFTHQQELDDDRMPLSRNQSIQAGTSGSRVTSAIQALPEKITMRNVLLFSQAPSIVRSCAFPTLAVTVVALFVFSGCDRPLRPTNCGAVRCGRIAFVSDREGNKEIYVVKTKGTGLVRLTHHPADDFDPVWSADGNSIVFRSDRDDDNGMGDVYRVNADGSGAPVLLTDLGGSSPSWSADGKVMVVSGGSNEDIGIYVVSRDGAIMERLTDSTTLDLMASISPDGSQVTFYSNRDGDDIYVVNSDGSGFTRLSHHPAGGNFSPQWSPDGNRIAFVSTRDGQPEIYAINADGTDLTRLTDHPAEDLLWSWSPDGSQMLFFSERDGISGLYLMDNTGANVSFLTDMYSVFGGHAWSPDGSQIALVSERDSNSEIYIISTSGNIISRLTYNAANDTQPDWTGMAPD